MTYKRFREIVDNNDVTLLRERQFEISKKGWHDLTMEMEFTIDEVREFADKIDWYFYVGRMGWNDKIKYLEFADKDYRLKNALEIYEKERKKEK